ncbi:MAG TPA: ATP-binding protein [candidate division Zixibacteria bacterium]
MDKRRIIRNLFSFSYESEIKLALLFFILFLVLLNFGTVHLLSRTRDILENEHKLRLLSASISVKEALDNLSSQKIRDIKGLLSDLRVRLEVDNIFILGKDGEVLYSSQELGQEDLTARFYGISPSKHTLLKNNQAVTSDFYERGNKTYTACYLPLKGNEILMVEAKAEPLKIIDNAFRLDVLMRLVGLLAVAVSTIFFLKAILKPYRMIKKEAKDAKLPIPSKFEGADQDIDFVVDTFQKVIVELKEKEAKLQKLYQETSQKAKDLSRYNEYILGSMNSGLIICDTGGLITHFNKEAQNMLDLSEEETLNKNYSVVLVEQGRLTELIKDALQNHKVYLPKEMHIARKDEGRIWVSVNSSLIRDEDNKLMGVVLLINDLSDIKNLQREVATKDKMAALGEMAGGLAHQLRNSVAAILGFGKLLKKMIPLDESNQEIIDGIIKESNVTEEMLRKFLSFAKPQDISLEKVDLAKIIEDVLNSLEDRIKQWKVKIYKRYEKTLEPIFGDKLLLKQCFQNLVQNAIEAIPQGGTIQISIRREKWNKRKYSEGVRFMEIKITDNGEGIPLENLERIFNPFFTSKEKGTGLGLSLVRKIITMHNGRIEVESQIKRGSTFKIYLPVELKCLSDNSRKSDVNVSVSQM